MEGLRAAACHALQGRLRAVVGLPKQTCKSLNHTPPPQKKIRKPFNPYTTLKGSLNRARQGAALVFYRTLIDWSTLVLSNVAVFFARFGQVHFEGLR